MSHSPDTGRHTVRFIISWTVVGIPLVWGIWNTLLKLPALFH